MGTMESLAEVGGEVGPLIKTGLWMDVFTNSQTAPGIGFVILLGRRSSSFFETVVGNARRSRFVTLKTCPHVDVTYGCSRS